MYFPSVVFFSVAPIKALCAERYLDWSKKFQPHGLGCMELTGDTEMDHIGDLHKTNLILTTPVNIAEKKNNIGIET